MVSPELRVRAFRAICRRHPELSHCWDAHGPTPVGERAVLLPSSGLADPSRAALVAAVQLLRQGRVDRWVLAHLATGDAGLVRDFHERIGWPVEQEPLAQAA